MIKPTQKEIKEFLSESNLIEGVSDNVSLEQARHAWRYLKRQNKLSIGVILKTHKILMLHQNLYPNEKGYFRRVPVWVGGKEGVSFEKISEEISHWIMNVNDLIKNGKNENSIFLEETIKTQHINYERIHPFVDGNGRTGRMFMNWTRLKCCNLPLLIIKASERYQYYEWFK